MIIRDNKLSFGWLVVVLLVPVAVLNYMDRQMIASMKSSVMADVAGVDSDAQWGYMLGQFKWCYALCSPLGGLLADRFSRRWTIGLSLVSWSVVTYLTGEVTSYSGLLWTRTAMGISEAFYIPAALALLSDYHSGATRSKAVGLHQMGIYVGVILGGFGGFAADSPDIGWRGAFRYLGLIGVLYALPLMWILRDTVRETSAGPHRDSGASLINNKFYWIMLLYFTLPALAAWVVRDWMPSLLKSHFGMGQGMAGVSATIYWQVAAIVAALFAGYWADRWSKVSARGRIYVSAIGVSMIVPALILVGIASSKSDLTTAIGALILFGIGWGFFDCNNMPILCQIVRPDQRATGYGFMNMVSISCGGLADLGFGMMLDHKIPMPLVFGAFASCCVISIILVLCIQPRDPTENA